MAVVPTSNAANDRPGKCDGNSTPANRNIVGAKSRKQTKSSLTEPGFNFPGQRMINGVRVPESYSHRFPRGSP